MFDRSWNIVIDKLEGWREGVLASLPNFAVALLVLLAFALLARALSKLSERTVTRVAEASTLGRVAASLVRVSTIAVGLFIALEILGLSKAVTSLLAGAGILGLAIGFAFQDLAANFIAGTLLAYRRPFHIGQLIETNGYLGFVRKMNLRNTFVETFQGQMVLIPNRLVFEKPLENYSYTGRRRADFKVPVPYEVNPKEARRVAENAISRFDWLADDKPVEAFALDFGERGFDLQVRYWVVYPGPKDYFEALHDGVAAIREAFETAGIPINYPIEMQDTYRRAAE